jgi:hypothetical protein
VSVLSLLLSTVLAVSTYSQQAPAPAQPATGVITDQELAKSAHNPFEDFVKLPVQSTTGFELGRHHKAGDSFNVEPLVPFSAELAVGADCATKLDYRLPAQPA